MGSRTRQPQGLSVSNGQKPAQGGAFTRNSFDQMLANSPSAAANRRRPIGMFGASPQPQNFMGAMNATAQPGVTYNTQMQQQLANNSAQSQAPIGSSFIDALGRQQGVSYNTDMQKRMANASAISQGLPPPFPGY